MNQLSEILPEFLFQLTNRKSLGGDNVFGIRQNQS
jgi:hypothetical protein